MDVVKRNIEKLKGHIEVDSTPGTGTAITIRIPLTLAIIQGMLLRAGRERYVIPMLNIRESFRPDKRDVSSVTGKGEIITIRGELLPFFRLASLFDIENAAMHPEDGIVVVIEDGNDRTALLVDELLGQQQVVIKSLQNVGGNIRGISGACILNDGCVGLILDSRGIIHLAIHESQEAVV
jgi:two-component system chemotaxis sensor kinase CheA